MYPKLNKVEIIKGKLRVSDNKPKVYGSIEHVFHAFKIKEPFKFRDIYYYYTDKKLNRLKKNILNPPDSEYYLLSTSVGIGSKDKEKIKRVHIRFAILPLNRIPRT